MGGQLRLRHRLGWQNPLKATRDHEAAASPAHAQARQSFHLPTAALGNQALSRLVVLSAKLSSGCQKYQMIVDAFSFNFSSSLKTRRVGSY